LKYRCAHPLIDHIEQFLLGARSRLDREVEIEFAADHRDRRQYRLCLRRETRETARDEIGDRDGKAKLRHRPPFPMVAIVPDRAFLDESAQHLDDEERIAFRVMIEEREQLAPDFLAMKGRLEPLLQLIAREARERELAEPLIARQPATPLERFPLHLLGANRQADEQVLGAELPDEEFEHVPRRRIGPLDVIEHDDEEAVARRRSHVLGDLLEQHVFAADARARCRPVGRGERRDEMRQLVPRPVGWGRGTTNGGQHLRPGSIRGLDVGFAPSPDDERA
jgi:hypothetical protein